MKTGPGLDAAHEVGIEEPDDVAHKDAGDSHHHSGIDPVVKVRAPADDELGHAGILECLVSGEHGLLGVIVTGAGAGIKLGDFSVRHRSGQTEQEGAEDAQPHGRRCGAGTSLDDKSEPKEGPGGDEGHCVCGQPGKAQGGLHLRCFLICHEHSPEE